MIGLALLYGGQVSANNFECKMGIHESGTNHFPINANGKGTKGDPYQLVFDESLCDITLVKQQHGTDKSYPEDKIYFEYQFNNVPGESSCS